MHLEEIIKNISALFGSLFVSVMFLQSGLDKVFDRQGNLEWLTGHFSKTFVRGMVPLMLLKITILEVATGILAAAGIIYFLAAGSTLLIFAAAVLGTLTITALFFGQRISKDYAGAAILVPYFILFLLLLTVTNPYR